MPVWPDLDLDACAAQLPDLQAEWMRCLATLDEEGLDDGVAYRNSKGEFWTNSVTDILTHVVLHAAYHRGQIAAAIREAGGTPAYTDYIHAVRSGLMTTGAPGTLLITLAWPSVAGFSWSGAPRLVRPTAR
jgi:hypothetical protein